MRTLFDSRRGAARRAALYSCPGAWLLFSGCVAPGQGEQAAVPASRIIVKFNHPIAHPADAAFVADLSRSAQAGLSYVSSISSEVHVFALSGQNDENAMQQSLRNLAARPDVVFAEPDRKRKVQ
jgi:hypothetical protein